VEHQMEEEEGGLAKEEKSEKSFFISKLRLL
jgi:hypothetical protein